MSSQDQVNQLDSDLQRSLDELDQQFQSNSDDNVDEDDQVQQSDENEEEDMQEENQKGKKDKKQKNHLREKKSAYNILLPPDEDVQTIPPYVVVVHGSKTSGKSSLIRSLVKHYTKHKIDEINGTITLRSNKRQRITIIQCPNDIRAMIDLSKIADIVLLVLDASLGFQMETFQFLSLLKCHGFPHVMGVVTHIDFYKDNKQLRKTKKKFKKRFEEQVGGNNKLFYMTKWDNGLYHKIQTAKVARYIGTSSPPKILWRANHPYIIADRWQTIEDNHYKKDDEVNVQFYGYVRGASYRMNGKIHFVGMGDYEVKQIQVIGDPCPEYKREETKEQNNEQNEGEQVEGEEDSDDDIMGEEKQKQNLVSEITKKRKKRKTLNQNQRIIYAPSCNLGTLSFEHTSGFVTIPHQYVKFTRKDDSDQSQVEEGVELVRNLQNFNKKSKAKEEVQLFEGMQLDQGSEEEEDDHKEEDHFIRKKKQIQIMKEKTQNRLIGDPNQNYERRDDLNFLIYESKQKMITHDCSKYHPQEREERPDIKNLFVTGMDTDALNQMQSQEEDEYEKAKKQLDKTKNLKKAKISEQTNFFQKGYYVKIVLEKIKYQDYLQISNKMPVVLTRINIGQDNCAFLKVKFRRHRWYTNLLKSNDPIIVSSGWRRYQTMMTFATEDQNQRLRYLKYTPHHDFCIGVFYGNFNQQNSGCIFTQTIKDDIKKFRIAGSGIISQINKSFQIMKKIKLIGQPYKIMKNTAFIRGMFNSSIEVANYIGAQIRTVSGIRGQIKKSLKEGGDGTYRATFQDKILISDIVFCRAWYRVILERFYNPLLNFGKNRLMKTKYELKMEKGVESQKKPDSEYKDVDRAPQVFTPFMMSKKLQKNLPFKTLEKVKMDRKERIKRKQNASMPKILMSDKQRETAALIQRLNTIKKQKEERRQVKLKQHIKIKQARERPRQQYYEKLKKEQKSKKMADLTRKKNKEQKGRRNRSQ